jgi:2,4-dienoyl-CoA reductase-like NADH-dependent reductase (Old Yellow Enzyme family)
MRTDKYGGGIEGRATALFEVYSRIRETVGDDYPILIKINCADFVENGLKLEESLWVAKKLAGMGIDAIEVSGGVGNTLEENGKSIQKGVPHKRPEGYFLQYADNFRESVDVPVIAVGGIRTLQTAQKTVAEGRADLVSMCRPFICEPLLLKRWHDGDTSPARCVSCNRCLARTIFEGLQCFSKKKRRENASS